MKNKNRCAFFSTFLFLFLINSCFLFAQPFRLSAVSDLVQVFEDGYNLPAIADTIEVFGMRGEVISGQCVISAKKNLTNVTATNSRIRAVVSNPYGSKEIIRDFMVE